MKIYIKRAEYFLSHNFLEKSKLDFHLSGRRAETQTGVKKQNDRKENSRGITGNCNKSWIICMYYK